VSEEKIAIREMTIADYDDLVGLWTACEGIVLRPEDSRQGLARFLQRNPELSLVARSETGFLGQREGEAEGGIVGAVLCGHDGRRGTIRHLAVLPDYRRQGIGRQLVEQCLCRLRAEGILRCNAFIHRENPGAAEFWITIGWDDREDLRMISR
jgi:ribosomal protein S18 acetylase RimI-like enzyme